MGRTGQYEEITLDEMERVVKATVCKKVGSSESTIKKKALLSKW